MFILRNALFSSLFISLFLLLIVKSPQTEKTRLYTHILVWVGQERCWYPIAGEYLCQKIVTLYSLWCTFSPFSWYLFGFQHVPNFGLNLCRVYSLYTAWRHELQRKIKRFLLLIIKFIHNTPQFRTDISLDIFYVCTINHFAELTLHKSQCRNI